MRPVSGSGILGSMESEQSDDPDEPPGPLPDEPVPADPLPASAWQQRRVDRPKRHPLEVVAIVIAICAAVVLGISGLAGLAIVILFNIGFSHWGSNK